MDTPEWTTEDRLAKSLRLSGLTREQIAAALGTHRNTVTHWLEDASPMRPGDFVVWAQVTGVPLEWLTDSVNLTPYDVTAQPGRRIVGRRRHAVGSNDNDDARDDEPDMRETD